MIYACGRARARLIPLVIVAHREAGGRFRCRIRALRFQSCVAARGLVGLVLVPVMLDYRSPSLQRTTVRRCLAFAVTLIGLAVSLIAPLAISVAGVYWNDPPLVLIGAILSGVLLATAFGLAAAAVEQLCDLRD